MTSGTTKLDALATYGQEWQSLTYAQKFLITGTHKLKTCLE